MAQQETKTNEKQNQQSQEQELTRSSESQQRGMERLRGYSPLGSLFTPGDIFLMGPFTVMRRLSEEFDRMLDQAAVNRGNGGKTTWSPAIEVSERDGSFVVRAELPGMNPADVKLEMTNDALVLQGERKSEHEETKGGVHVTERRYGRFYRSIPLPEGANIEQARAKFENGVLEVNVPVQQDQRNKPREIPIEASSPASTGNAGKAA